MTPEYSKKRRDLMDRTRDSVEAARREPSVLEAGILRGHVEIVDQDVIAVMVPGRSRPIRLPRAIISGECN